MNRLADETSPYLKQHRDNPVDWYPWCDEALQLAVQADKPILLSVGYSACHWCHVMAHESFEDPETARIMNEHFVCIKVDREERPDIDKIYQEAHSMLTERPGGWPLTVFLTPDERLPIYAGTYFPPDQRHNLPSFQQVLSSIHDVWTNRRADIQQQNDTLKKAYHRIADTHEQYDGELTALPLDLFRNQIQQQFDDTNGGFSVAPKFPHPGIIERTLSCWNESQEQDEPALHMAIFSLQKMCAGGVFDQLGGGFFRYSTDEQWIIPHFEKMLYDNGSLLELTCRAWCITGDPVLETAARATADWVLREMQADDGGFYAALDADSQGEEGTYYIWSLETFDATINEAHRTLLKEYYGLDREPNFEGRWHLHQAADIETLSRRYQLEPPEIRSIIAEQSGRLLAARSERSQPGLDHKRITSWNGMMIRGLAIAARTFSNKEYTEAALRAADNIRKNGWRNQRLLAIHPDGSRELNGYLDDYAYLLSSLIEILQNNWDNDLLNWAVSIADALLTHFEDAEGGGFFYTSDDHEQLLQRSRTFHDEATPSGNAIAAIALIHLGYLLGENRYILAAERCVRASWDQMQQHPIAHSSMLSALALVLQPPRIIIVRPREDHWSVDPRYYLDNRTLVFQIPADARLPDALMDKRPGDTTLAYICTGHSCQPPVYDLNTLLSVIHKHSTPPKA